jgi:hypothetical protein
MSRPPSKLRDAAVRHILAGEPPKSFAALNGISYPWVIKTICNAGLRRYFLTEDEHRHIMERRKNLRLIRKPNEHQN